MSKFDEKRWVDQVKGDLTLDRKSYGTSLCIFSASTAWLKENEDAYVPQIVSIGPYHFGKDKLSGMETFKGEAARKELVRIQTATGNSDFTFDQVVAKIKSREEDIKLCYDKEIPHSSELLGWMMARDACFILEFFRNYVSPSPLPDLHPIFGPKSCNTGVKSDIVKDLIKLENQIPLFVLEEVLAMEKGDSLENGKSELQKLLKAVFGKVYYRPFKYCGRGESPRQRHILDIYYFYCLGEESGYVVKDSYEERTRSKFPSAVELKNIGLKIQANGAKLEDVRFHGETLFIPPIKFDVDSEIYIRNLIALETCSPYSPLKRMTTYVQFMDELCETEEAVSLMRKEKIFIGNLRQPSRVIQLLNFSNLVAFQPTCVCIDEAWSKLNERYKGAWRVLLKEFVQAQFLNPNKAVDYISTILILLLTVVQTFCAFTECKGR